MTTPIANGESGSSVRTKLNSIIAKVDGIEAGATVDQDLSTYQQKLSEGAFVDGDKTKLNGIADAAEVNTIDSSITGEPTGSDQVVNVVSLTQAEYDAGTPISTTFYVIV